MRPAHIPPVAATTKASGRLSFKAVWRLQVQSISITSIEQRTTRSNTSRCRKPGLLAP